MEKEFTGANTCSNMRPLSMEILQKENEYMYERMVKVEAEIAKVKAVFLGTFLCFLVWIFILSCLIK